MFEALGQRLSSLFSGLRGKVNESDLKEFAAQIKIALIDSDVAIEVADKFSNQIFEKSKLIENEINKSTNPATAPEATPSEVGWPSLIFSTNNQPNAAAAVAT